ESALFVTCNQCSAALDCFVVTLLAMTKEGAPHHLVVTSRRRRRGNPAMQAGVRKPRCARGPVLSSLKMSGQTASGKSGQSLDYGAISTLHWLVRCLRLSNTCG